MRAASEQEQTLSNFEKLEPGIHRCKSVNITLKEAGDWLVIEWNGIPNGQKPYEKDGVTYYTKSQMAFFKPSENIYDKTTKSGVIKADRYADLVSQLKSLIKACGGDDFVLENADKKNLIPESKEDVQTILDLVNKQIANKECWLVLKGKEAEYNGKTFWKFSCANYGFCASLTEGKDKLKFDRSNKYDYAKLIPTTDDADFASTSTVDAGIKDGDAPF